MSDTSPMKRVMYLSRASRKMFGGELRDLLAGARLRNEERGVTGLLVYNAGYFAQVLEGPVEIVDELMAKIRADPRHTEYQLISEGPITHRYFDGWAMDWANLESFDDTQHPELRRYLQEHSIADRSAIYPALVLFIRAHTHGRPTRGHLPAHPVLPA